jgi:hypothetical protein
MDSKFLPLIALAMIIAGASSFFWGHLLISGHTQLSARGQIPAIGRISADTEIDTDFAVGRGPQPDKTDEMAKSLAMPSTPELKSFPPVEPPPIPPSPAPMATNLTGLYQSERSGKRYILQERDGNVDVFTENDQHREIKVGSGAHTNRNISVKFYSVLDEVPGILTLNVIDDRTLTGNFKGLDPTKEGRVTLFRLP